MTIPGLPIMIIIFRSIQIQRNDITYQALELSSKLSYDTRSSSGSPWRFVIIQPTVVSEKFLVNALARGRWLSFET